KDGALAYLHLAQQMTKQPEILGHAFNFSNEIQVTALNMVERILSAMNSKLAPDIRAEAKNEIKHQYLSAAKARRMLGWQPKYDLDRSLDETIWWYRRYFASPANEESPSSSIAA